MESKIEKAVGLKYTPVVAIFLAGEKPEKAGNRSPEGPSGRGGDAAFGGVAGYAR